MSMEAGGRPMEVGRWKDGFGVLLAGLCPAPRLWLVLLLLFCLNLAWLAFDPRLSLSPGSWWTMGLVAVGTLFALVWRQGRRDRPDQTREKLLNLLLVALFAGFLTQQVNLFSHLAMSLGMPLADQRLAAWDRALGFDWNAYGQWVGAAHWSRAMLFLAYAISIGPALLVILACSIWSGRRDRVDEVAFLALGSGLVCISVAGLMPSVSAWNSVATANTKDLLGPQSQLWLDQLAALRSGAAVRLDLRSLEGLATFPSFHTCLAVIILWCSRGTWPGWLAGSVVGLAIIVSTPAYGSHYGVDVLAGAAVTAGLALAWVRIASGPRRAGGRP
jgi:hypothetical protein